MALIKAVLFDVGGVVFYAAVNAEKALRFAEKAIRLLGARGIAIPDPPAVFAERLGAADRLRKRDNELLLREFPPEEVWERYYLAGYDFDPARLYPIAERLCFLWNEARNDITMRPGLVEALAALQEDGYRLGIISNTVSRTHVPYKLAEYGVSHYFELVLSSSVSGLRKPDPAIFRLAERAMGLDKSELAYVGDTISRDVIGARKAGWGLVIRLKNGEEREGVRQREAALAGNGFEPDLNIDELCELPAALRAYQNDRNDRE